MYKILWWISMSNHSFVCLGSLLSICSTFSYHGMPPNTSADSPISGCVFSQPPTTPSSQLQLSSPYCPWFFSFLFTFMKTLLFSPSLVFALNPRKNNSSIYVCWTLVHNQLVCSWQDCWSECLYCSGHFGSSVMSTDWATWCHLVLYMASNKCIPCLVATHNRYDYNHYKLSCSYFAVQSMWCEVFF